MKKCPPPRCGRARRVAGGCDGRGTARQARGQRAGKGVRALGATDSGPEDRGGRRVVGRGCGRGGCMRRAGATPRGRGPVAFLSAMRLFPEQPCGCAHRGAEPQETQPPPPAGTRSVLRVPDPRCAKPSKTQLGWGVGAPSGGSDRMARPRPHRLDPGCAKPPAIWTENAESRTVGAQINLSARAAEPTGCRACMIRDVARHENWITRARRLPRPRRTRSHAPPRRHRTRARPRPGRTAPGPSPLAARGGRHANWL